MSILNSCMVLDMSEVYQAPLAAQVLGDFGANVIKIERPDTGEILRGMDAHANRHGLASSYYAAANRNKRSIVLDLKLDAARDVVRRLAKSADVLIHNYRPGVMERLGLGYGDLSGINPRIVYATATGYGETGPLAGKPGQDMAIQSISGMAMESAGADGKPILMNAPAADFASGMILAQGIILALLEREKSGRGQKVNACLLDTAIAMQSLEAASQLMYGYRTTWFDKGLNFVFATKDGWLTVLGFFRSNPLRLICRALEIEDLSGRPDLATPEQQVANRDEIDRLVRDEFRKYPTGEIIARLEAQDILCAPILSLREALDHPQVRHNGMVASMTIASQGEVQVVGNPLKLSRTPPTIRSGPSALGADTSEVLGEAGFSKQELATLAKAGAFGR
jgi:crotonobetainyl-CoA:carnitine CoA-transferase CaiB-like acyl-CoA transferase